MLDKNEIPEVGTLARVALYFAAVIALGMSFSFTLGLMNDIFVFGALGTAVNVFLSLAFVRYVAVTHFLNQDS